MTTATIIMENIQYAITAVNFMDSTYRM